MTKRLNLERLYLLIRLVALDFDTRKLARERNTRPGAVFQQLHLLERELGTPVFHRPRRGGPLSSFFRAPSIDRLTPAGRRLVAECTGFFASLPDIEHKAIRANALSNLLTF